MINLAVKMCLKESLPQYKKSPKTIKGLEVDKINCFGFFLKFYYKFDQKTVTFFANSKTYIVCL